MTGASRDSNVLTGRFRVIAALDPTFAGRGFLIYDDVLGSDGVGFDQEYRAVAVQPDGRIVVAGSTFVAGAEAILVQRYLADGTLDRGFGAGGTATQPGQLAAALALQDDGKIVIAGAARGSRGTALVLLRFDATGALDPSFGQQGRVTLEIDNDVIGRAVTVQRDGKILIAGSAIGFNVGRAIAVRLTPDGTLDASFGAGGIVRYPVAAGALDTGFAALAIQSDDKILVAGSGAYEPLAPTFTDALVVRLDPAGGVDASFGRDGAVTMDGDVSDGVTGVAVLPDGQIVVGGMTTSYSSFRNRLWVSRLTADGGFDGAFGAGGTVTWQRGLPDLMAANSMALAPDGAVVLAGYLESELLVLCFGPDGRLDPAFGADGMVEVNGGGITHGWAVAMEPDGKVVVAGRSTFHDGVSDAGAFLARLLARR